MFLQSTMENSLIADLKIEATIRKLQWINVICNRMKCFGHYPINGLLLPHYKVQNIWQEEFLKSVLYTLEVLKLILSSLRNKTKKDTQ